ncbi:MAG: isoprenylcysteine carboxylmethyltransferase family protein [Alphaproteobacteria bacterium]|nr:isoprenylcysteine carboxylmethyltransferase family protein [Alphaproteobacteria bacterium]
MENLDLSPPTVILGIWLAWVISWLAAAAWSKPAARKAGLAREFLYRAAIFGGALVLAVLRRFPHGLDTRLWPPSPDLQWGLVAAVAAGCLFTWWARLHLGSLWSSNVTRKDDHRVIDTGPYRIVRHPIYTGMILALLATALEYATPLVFAGIALMIIGIVMKARLEEGFLRSELGKGAYDTYARRVPMLVPFWPRRTD